ncbi:hypothetical protein EV361DRAFT_1035584, partial [Lentinula raphanica]
MTKTPTKMFLFSEEPSRLQPPLYPVHNPSLLLREIPRGEVSCPPPSPLCIMYASIVSSFDHANCTTLFAFGCISHLLFFATMLCFTASSSSYIVVLVLFVVYLAIMASFRRICKCVGAIHSTSFLLFLVSFSSVHLFNNDILYVLVTFFTTIVSFLSVSIIICFLYHDTFVCVTVEYFSVANSGDIYVITCVFVFFNCKHADALLRCVYSQCRVATLLLSSAD